jgi:hypothetical protein
MTAGRLSVADLQFGNFPAVFQFGIGAEQLQLLHTVLRNARAPMPLDEIMAALPDSCKKLDHERVKLLLEVRMASLYDKIHPLGPTHTNQEQSLLAKRETDLYAMCLARCPQVMASRGLFGKSQHKDSSGKARWQLQGLNANRKSSSTDKY